MHEHYEDTPWREQALYANDARTQALCGYYAFGETQFPASSFSLLGHGLREDGFLELTAPARPKVTIPSFSLVWMLAVRDHYLFSGDRGLAEAFLPRIQSMLQAFLDERREGLLPLRQAQGIWHFYDWVQGMSGYTPADFERGLEADCPLNCFLILALDAVQQIQGWLGEGVSETVHFAEAAQQLRECVAEAFWSKEEGIFLTTRETPQCLHELTQGLAVLAGVGSAAMRSAALERLSRNDSGLVEVGLSQSLYTMEALMSNKAQYGATVLERIDRVRGGMIRTGSSMVWETIRGASDFSNAGSLCHGWSAVPLYIYYAHVLGIRPLEPGFRLFASDPMRDVLPSFAGTVPVPGGEIRVCWDDRESAVGYQLTAPDGCLKAVE